MFDTHCHLTDPQFENIFLDVIGSARQKGVNYFLIPSTNLSDSKKSIRLASNFKSVFVGVGVHPTEKLEGIDFEKLIGKLYELIRTNDKVAAVGEVGLDYYHYESPFKLQRELFALQIKLAVATGKSLIVHNRHASEDTIKLLKSNWKSNLQSRVVFHCCEANDLLLNFAINKSVFIGVDGDITYDVKKMDFFKKVPIERIVLETDSPYLTPEPLRSVKKYPNMPENLWLIAKQLSILKKVDLNALIEQTTRNAKTLFLLS